MNRRSFLSMFAAVPIVAMVPSLLELPSTRKIFLPPTGGWVGGNRLLTPEYITREALIVLQQKLYILGTDTTEVWWNADAQGDLWSTPENPGNATVRIPPRYKPSNDLLISLYTFA